MEAVVVMAAVAVVVGDTRAFVSIYSPSMLQIL